LEEVDVAKMLGAISHPGMSVKEAKSVAAVLRKVVLAPPTYRFADLKEAFELRTVLHARIPKDSTQGSQENTKWQHPRSPADNVNIVDAWIAIELAKRQEMFVTLFLYRGKDDDWVLDTSTPKNPRESTTKISGWRAGYVLNLAEIFAN
jgi:hypothetical protein